MLPERVWAGPLMNDPARTSATVPLLCRGCGRQFLLPLDDFEDLPGCPFCGTPELNWVNVTCRTPDAIHSNGLEQNAAGSRCDVPTGPDAR